MPAPSVAEPVRVIVVDSDHGFWSDAVTYAPLGTLLVAALAVFVAWRQWWLARKLREEQARPYVVVSLEMNGSSAVELVVQNLGKTLARDVVLEFDPPARTALRLADGHPDLDDDALPLPEFPVLVPGQRWVTLWDTIHRRRDSGLDSRYQVTVRCTDSKGKKLAPLSYVLDWEVETKFRATLVRHGMHEAVLALRDATKKADKTAKQVERIAIVQRNRSRPWWERLRTALGR